ncbi:serine/threonine-protein kinase [Sorangium sp. So ce131]|uniref:serine/threonine-protein kinase n=1 Tax=Sorangium sp. So ce131 TaxID=3133282 RepID=UPI003F610E4E
MVLLEERAVIAGKYRLERALARGGMGAVWVARHLQLEIDVAIKFMEPELASSPDARRRFEREARAAAKLSSPHVVRMLDYGAEDGTLFLAMELLEGEDLDARLARSGRLTPAAASAIVAQVCKALECAHDAGIVHRDLKPANIFLARQGREEMVKVLDFGIAKAMAPTLAPGVTKTGTLLGSPYYMSPEQVRRSKEVDPRSDLWSLGVILFQCLTGRVPFAGEELGDVLVAICSDEIPLPSQLVPELGPGVDGFLGRALARRPDHRFQSARELAEAFAGVVHAAGGAPQAYGRPPYPSATRGASAPFLPLTAGGALEPHAGAGAPAPPAAAITAHSPGMGPAPRPGAASSPGTLSPASATFSTSPGRRRWMGMSAAVLGGVVLLGLAGIALKLRGPPPSPGVDSPSAPADVRSAQPSSTDSAPSPSSPAVPSTPASFASAPSSADVPASPSPSARGLHEPISAFPQPKTKVPVPGKPGGQPRRDPLEHR